jgi:hypothetical protein
LHPGLSHFSPSAAGPGAAGRRPAGRTCPSSIPHRPAVRAESAARSPLRRSSGAPGSGSSVQSPAPAAARKGRPGPQPRRLKPKLQAPVPDGRPQLPGRDPKVPQEHPEGKPHGLVRRQPRARKPLYLQPQVDPPGRTRPAGPDHILRPDPNQPLFGVPVPRQADEREQPRSFAQQLQKGPLTAARAGGRGYQRQQAANCLMPFRTRLPDPAAALRLPGPDRVEQRPDRVAGDLDGIQPALEPVGPVPLPDPAPEADKRPEPELRRLDLAERDQRPQAELRPILEEPPAQAGRGWRQPDEVTGGVIAPLTSQPGSGSGPMGRKPGPSTTKSPPQEVEKPIAPGSGK